MLVKIDRAFHALTCFLPFHGYFSRSCVIGAMRLSLYPHGSESILLGFGAVMMLGGRQSGETFRSALPEPILNVDMLIVTFKFLPLLTTHENTLLLYYRHFSENAHDFLKSLQFVHDDSPSCIVSTRDFC